MTEKPSISKRDLHLYVAILDSFFQINVSISGCLPENSLLNYELKGSCLVQIGWVEVQICNLKEDLHTEYFPIPFNGKSGIVCHLRYVHMVNSRGMWALDVYVLYGMNQYNVQLGKASVELNMVHDEVGLGLFLTVSLCEEIFQGKRGYSDGGAILTSH